MVKFLEIGISTFVKVDTQPFDALHTLPNFVTLFYNVLFFKTKERAFFIIKSLQDARLYALFRHKFGGGNLYLVLRLRFLY